MNTFMSNYSIKALLLLYQDTSVEIGSNTEAIFICEAIKQERHLDYNSIRLIYSVVEQDDIIQSMFLKEEGKQVVMFFLLCRNSKTIRKKIIVQNNLFLVEQRFLLKPMLKCI